MTKPVWHLEVMEILDPYTLGFWIGWRMETEFISLAYLLLAKGKDQVVLLNLLELLAAFDTIE